MARKKIKPRKDKRLIGVMGVTVLLLVGFMVFIST